MSPGGAPGQPSRFDSHVESYDAACAEGLALSGEDRRFFSRGRIADLRRWWSEAGRAEPRRILDYGCGVGDSSPLLAEAFPEAEVTGLDPSAGFVERAQREHAAPRVRFAVLAEAAGEARADLVYLNGVVHHVPAAERDGLFADLAARVRPGGVVALFENNPVNPGTRLVMRRIPFDRDAEPVWPREARRRLRAAGLEPRATHYLFYFPAALAFLRPLERALRRVPLGAQYGVLAER